MTDFCFLRVAGDFMSTVNDDARFSSKSIVLIRTPIDIKPASHRTSLMINDSNGDKISLAKCLLRRRNSGTYKDLPEELRTSVMPVRKSFSVSRKALKDKAERQSTIDSASPDLSKRRPVYQAIDWKKRAELTKAKLEAAKLRYKEQTKTLPTVANESRLKKPTIKITDRNSEANMISDYRENHQQAPDNANDSCNDRLKDDKEGFISIKGFEIIVRDNDSIVMVKTTFDRQVILTALIEHMTRMLLQAKSESSLDETEDFYIDDDDVLNSGSNFPNGWSILSTSSSDRGISPSFSDDIVSIDSESTCSSDKNSAFGKLPDLLGTCNEDSSGNMVVSVEAQVGHTSSIQIHTNHEGIRGSHLVVAEQQNNQTAAKSVIRRIVSATTIVGQIKVPHSSSTSSMKLD